MNTRLSLIAVFLFTALSFLANAQAPQAFNYSAVARDAQGAPLAGMTIGIQLSILKSTTIGAIQYQENHFVNTDDFGLFNLVVGAGAIQQGDITAIDWSSDSYFLKVGMDASGSTNFITMGTTQLLSVPYALHAKTAESISGNLTETDPIYSNSTAAGITNSDTTNWNNKQNELTAGTGIDITSDVISLTGGSSNPNGFNLHFPDGVPSELVTMTNVTTFTTPVDKNFYMLSSTGSFIWTIGGVYYYGISGSSIRDMGLSAITVVGAGVTFTQPDPSNIIGYYVDKVVEYVYFDLNQGAYTVPSGKIWAKLSITGDTYQVDGVVLGANHANFVDENSVLSGTCAAIGYLIDK